MDPYSKLNTRPLIKLVAFFISTSLLFSACSTRLAPEKDIPEDDLYRNITYLISDPSLYNANLGVYIESLDTGDIIFKQNEHKLFIPASNMKLFTSATALIKFGPEFRYNTELYIDGEIDKGILSGDLIVRGKGDPSISPRFYDGDFRSVFSGWAAVLKENGITEIRGDLIGDASYFQNAPLGSGWEWDDEPYWYAAQISALTLNDNCVDLTITHGDSAGVKPKIEMYPQTDYVAISNRAFTDVPDSVNKLHITRERGKNTILIENSIPLNARPQKESITVENPALFFITVLREILEQNDIRITGNLRADNAGEGIDYNGYRLIHTHISPPLKDILRTINKVSHNLYVEQLLLTLGAEFGETGSASEGAKVVTRTMGGIGIPETEFIMQDGSGLSRKNLISPSATVILLRYMAHRDDFDIFYETLPIAGVDGTLRRLMKGTNAAGKVHAKTGTVGYVRNLSGYVESDGGERFIFSLLVNHYTVPTSSINLLQDRLCNLLARSDRNRN